MNHSLEELLRPLLDDFHNHVKTDPGEQLAEWVQKALKLSNPIHAALNTQYMLGYEMISPEHNLDLEKVLLHLFRYKAQEEQKLPFLLENQHIQINYFNPTSAGIGLRVHGLRDIDIKQHIRKSAIVAPKLLRYMTITPSSTGHMLEIPVPSNYPMVYTLENVRHLLNGVDGVTAEWQGEDRWRPDLALEVAVAGIQGHEYTKKFLLDEFISSHVGVSKTVYSRLDHLTHTYRAIMIDPMDVDHLLGVPIPLAKDQSSNYRFELMFCLGLRQSEGNASGGVLSPLENLSHPSQSRTEPPTNTMDCDSPEDLH